MLIIDYHKLNSLKKEKKMKKDCPRFTLRVSKELLYKVSYIAKFNGRTKNKEISQILKKSVNEFEKKYGMISVPDEIIDEDDE